MIGVGSDSRFGYPFGNCIGCWEVQRLHTKQGLCRVTCCVDCIQVLEDMLRACVLDHKGSWEEHLPLVEFFHNNSYQVSIQMTPYEALYGR